MSFARFSFSRDDVPNWEAIVRDLKSDEKRKIPVYIKDKKFHWLPAIASSFDHETETVKVTITLEDGWEKRTISAESAEDKVEKIIKLSEYPGKELPYANATENFRIVNRSDMADLPFLHEAALLYNLKGRYARGLPYTKVGDIVVSTNPFQWIDGLYSKETQSLFADKIIWNVKKYEEECDNRIVKEKDEPHIYEISSRAYKGICIEGKDQSIVVTGESGAGKTESIKLVINHLAHIQTTRVDVDTNNGGIIVEQVQQSNLLFESFGNAMTTRNENSSRFGKFTQLHYDVECKKLAGKEGRHIPLCTLAGSTIKTYMLEKSRVVGHSLGERSFHIFYQLLAAPEEFKVDLWEKGLANKSVSSFRYLSNGEDVLVDSYTNADCWKQTISDLELFGIVGDERMSMLKILCVVLQLGNLEFGPDPANDDASIVTNQDELEKAADILGVSVEDVTVAFTKRKVKMMREEVELSLRSDVAKENCDALAKEIYSRMFDHLVQVINKSMFATIDDTETARKYGVISLLDIYGFELFKVNGFEQFCINYCNEKLQNKYVSDVVFSVQVEYEAEGVHVFDASKVDNSAVLELIEGSTGLIALLNDECIRPKGNANTFVYKAKAVHKDSPQLIDELLHQRFEFGVKHFASPVKYDASLFTMKNSDVLPQELVNCAVKSSNKIIVDGFKDLAEKLERQAAEGRRRTNATENSVTSKFHRQVTDLVEKIGSARTWYIRCIKPNQPRKPFVLDHDMTISQLRSACIETAIVITRETFVNQLPFDTVLDRFGNLSETPSYGRYETPKDGCHELLLELLEGRERVVGGQVLQPFECGKTKVFFRTGMLEVLEHERERVFGAIAIVIQRWTRSFIAARTFKTLKKSTIKLQAWSRATTVRRSYREKINKAIKIEAFARRILARKELNIRREYKGARLFQSAWRMYACMRVLDKCKKAAKLIQKVVRRGQDRSNLKSSLQKIMREAVMNARLNDLRGKFIDLDQTGMNDNQNAVVNECEDMLTYLKYEVYRLRVENTHLRSDLMLAKKKEAEAVQKRNSTVFCDEVRFNTSKKISLAKRNLTLEEQLRELQIKNEEQRIEIKGLKENILTQEKKHEQDIESIKSSHTNELTALKQDFDEKEKALSVDVSELQNTIVSNEKKYENKLISVKAKAQKAHEISVTKMLNALDDSTSTVQRLSMSFKTKNERLSSIYEVMDGNPTNDSSDETGKDKLYETILSLESEVCDLEDQIDSMNKSHNLEIAELQRQLASPCIVCGAARSA